MLKGSFLEDYYKNQDQVNAQWQYAGLFSRAKIIIPENIVQEFTTEKPISILVLGSATEKNQVSFKKFYDFLRKGNGKKSDQILLLDINQYPLQSSREMGTDGSVLNQQQESPKFGFIQGDMRNLGIKEKSQELIVSDCTLNYLSDEQDVEQTFREMSRVIKPGGEILLRFRNNLIAALGLTTIFFESPVSRKGSQGGFDVLFLPSQLIISLAKKHNFNLVSFDTLVVTEDDLKKISYTFLFKENSMPNSS